jgi:hypothetical protein
MAIFSRISFHAAFQNTMFFLFNKNVEGDLLLETRADILLITHEMIKVRNGHMVLQLHTSDLFTQTMIHDI